MYSCCNFLTEANQLNMSISLYLGVLLFSFIITSISIIPAIDLLYRIRFLRKEIGTPTGGGALLIAIIALLFAILFPLSARFGVYVTSYYPLKQEINSVFFTFVSFGLLGLYEDFYYVFRITKKMIPQWLLQGGLSVIIGLLLYINLNISIINIPGLGVFDIGAGFVPICAIVIFLFTRGMQATKDLNGLSSGVLLICLIAIWAISFGRLDTPLSLLMSIWIGCLVAFLYFNVYPARILLGSAGSLAFGATLPVTGFLLGKPAAVAVVGALFLILGIASLLHSKWSLIAFLQKIGWPEPKIVFRVWVVAIVLAIIGLWMSAF